jgi:hypothetical protein
MFTNMKIALAGALILSAASAALANNTETTSSVGQSTIACPTLEGYPDCHPDERALSTEYSTNSRRPVGGRSRH